VETVNRLAGLMKVISIVGVMGAVAGPTGGTAAAEVPTAHSVTTDHVAAGTLPAAAPHRAASGALPCAPSAKACIALGSRKAWLTDGAGHILYGPVPTRGGTRGAATPTGTFSVLYKDRNHYSKQFDAPMPYSVFFYPGDALHADNPAVASNGCVHLNRSAAQRFYNGLHRGDRVQVVN
jgi:hypothetical protein